MIKQFEIEDLEKSNPISLFYEFGFDPEDIKSSIVNTFSEHFLNQENLNKYAINNLISTWILYITVYRDSPETLIFVNKLLWVFNSAKGKNANQTFDAYAQWFPEISQAISRFWSLHNSQTVLKKLTTEDYLEESLRIIGQSIEGISKPFLKLLLHVSRIRRGKLADFQKITSMDLGSVVDELINTEDMKNLFILPTYSIRLNQWRNIAYHHNSKIINKKIYLWYIKGDEDIQFKVNREGLTKTLLEISNLYKILRIVETIFCTDNLEQIEGRIKETKDELNIRNEVELLDFYSPISSQGFKITSLQSTDELAILCIQDMMEYPDLQKRAIHASQFLYHLWLYTSSNELKVEYFTSDSERFLTAEINSSSFLNIEEDIKFSELMKNVNFTFISLEMRQNEDPFLNLKLPKSLNKINQEFYSQEGELISLKDFIRRFTLSVLTNYLVFKSEGFEDKNIIMNVGSEGASIIGEDERGSFLLHTPAMLKSNEIQKFMIKIIDSTISKYKFKQLKVDIVKEALDRNRYVKKKQHIKAQIHKRSTTV